MRRLLLTRLAAVAGLTASAAVAVAQPARPTAFLHADPQGGVRTGQVKAVALRPNNEAKVYAYVENPTDAGYGTVTVTLSRTKDGSRPVAKGTLAGLKGMATAAVPLALVSAPAAPPAGKPGDPPPAAPGVVLDGDQLWLLTTSEGEDKTPLPAEPVAVGVSLLAPSSYLEAEPQPTFKAVGGEYELTVFLKDRLAEENGQRKPFAGPPAKVKLDLRPVLLPTLLVNPDGSLSKDGTYETAVPPGSPGVALEAKKLRFAGNKPAGRFAVTVDGYDRAFVFDISSEGNNATPLSAGFTRLDLPAYAVPGKPFPVRVEVFQEARGAAPVLTFARSTGGVPQELTAGKTTVRDETRTVKAGPDGELVFASVVKDWVVNVDTAGVYGKRAFKLTTNPPTAKPADEQVVVFDETPPVVTPEPLPVSKLVGSKLEVFAAVTDPETPITEVLFFLGDPPGPDGKLPPASEGRKGVPAPTPKGSAVAGRYTAAFDLPDAKGKVRLGVRATNAAGLVTTAELKTVADSPNLLVVEPLSPKDKAKRAVGDIKVRVIQGSTPERPQPGLKVELRSGSGGGTGGAGGAVVMAETTDDKGEAVFKDVPPGGYILHTVKLADLGAKATVAVTVKADKQTDAVLEVKR